MKNSRIYPIGDVAKVLLLLSFCLQLPAPTWADNNSVALLSETPRPDAVAPEPATTPSSTFLYGNVRHRILNQDDNAQGSVSDASLQAETPKQAETRLRAAAYKKLAQGFNLSSDEYRSLGVGCIGYESLRTFFQSKGKIIAVYKNSPAEKAGLKINETVIQDASDNEAKADPTVPLWSVSLAKEGDPVIYNRDASRTQRKSDHSQI